MWFHWRISKECVDSVVILKYSRTGIYKEDIEKHFFKIYVLRAKWSGGRLEIKAKFGILCLLSCRDTTLTNNILVARQLISNSKIKMSSPTCHSDETLALMHNRHVAKNYPCKECEPMSFIAYVKTGASPVLPIRMAIAILFCNIVLPGIGTMLSSITPSAKANRRIIIYMGLLQFFGAFLIFPYCWALFYSAQLISHSKMHQIEDDIRRLAAMKASGDLPSVETPSTHSTTDSPESDSQQTRSIHQFPVPIY